MMLLKRAVLATAAWVAANPVKAAQIGIAAAIVISTLATTRRLDGRTLRRAARAFL